MSSRSHSLLIISVQQRDAMGGTKTGVLNLADLAGTCVVCARVCLRVGYMYVRARVSCSGACVFSLIVVAAHSQ